MIARQMRLPEWLPSPVADYARGLVAGKELLEATSALRGRLKRLATDSRMKFVWVQLLRELNEHSSQFSASPDKFVAATDAWLRGYLLAAITADHNATFWHSAPSAREQEDTMRRLREVARELTKLLSEPLNRYEWTPWDRLTAAVVSARNAPVPIQDLLNRLATKTYGRYWPDATGNAAPSDSQAKSELALPLDARALLGDVPLQLQGLAMLAQLAVTEDVAARIAPPNKTQRLTRTVYAHNLVSYVKNVGLRARQPGHRRAGFHLYQIIAITTNVALNLSGREKISADTVRKLFDDDR